MTEVFVAEVGQLTARAARDLRKAGIVVAEVASLERCEFVRATEVMSADDLTWAALHALNLRGAYGSHGVGQRELFVSNLLTIMESARKKAAS